MWCNFYALRSNDRGHLVFVLSVVNFNLRYNFWTIRDRDFIFGMHTPLMTPFQMTPRSMTLWPYFDLEAENSFLDFVAAGGIVFHKYNLIFFLLNLSALVVSELFSLLTSSLGGGNSIFLSILPGRSNAESNISILFVAIITCVESQCYISF